MNTGNTVVSVLSVIALISPFVYAYIKNKRIQNELINNLKKHAIDNGFSLDRWEVDNTLILGIDEGNHIAFWGLKQGNEVKTSHVKLRDFSSCNVIRDNSKTGEELSTSLLEICFYPRDKKLDTQSFILFDERDGGRISGELMLGNKWINIYKEFIK
ncbi:MAG: hypothetical protein H3C31_01780 [Brumimicrobium sp.]|nr:hypothetical protein [Brumimicrobium sp.]